ncbi:MAG TPA: DEAD/DEAH box helicase, partial [Polyangiaceae bacterium]|nr:DEAD/DEAH box helicase [Polyangiaceae bacterium]
MTSSFERWFEDVTAFAPHAWQLALGTEHACSDRLLRIPTGFGKTAGAVLSWAYHRVVRNDATWPTRLVFCLPMRVLVEQTERSIEAWFEKAKLDVPVIVLLGGRAEEGWLEHPERPAVVIGTQDMLLSRALTRGYGSTRGLWPMEMGMVHGDALWVIDEVQLMDVGLATSAQLHAFRVAEAKRTAAIRPTFTWWMSATLQPSWLETIDFNAVRDTRPRPAMRIESAQRHGGLWDVKKRLERRADVAAPEEVAALVRERHRPGSMTLVVVNTVDRAKRVDAAVSKLKVDAELRLVHSRFRAKERALWDFLR